jgi:hypothetical protein
MTRINKTTEVISDDFELDDDVAGHEITLNGVLSFQHEESDPDTPVYVSIGSQQLGYITKEALVELAQSLITTFHKEEKTTEIE